jgi:hypothetical protein
MSAFNKAVHWLDQEIAKVETKLERLRGARDVLEESAGGAIKRMRPCSETVWHGDLVAHLRREHDGCGSLANFTQLKDPEEDEDARAA